MNCRSLSLRGRSACFVLTLCAITAGATEARAADVAQTLPGFKLEKLYNVPPQQGSWVSMTVDPKGRLITSDQYGKLYRVHLGGEKVKVEPLAINIGGAHGLLYAHDSLYLVNSAGLHRIRDTNGDDQFDQVKLLRKLRGGGEHGPHGVVLGPDGKSIYLVAGNHTDLPPVEKSRVPRNWAEDHLLPRMWDARGHARGKLAPGGWICRTDPEGKTFELISNGYRNAYDLAFNKEGELFTYDSDMEWDIGAPWYRPTRVVHATSGSEFGWRSGTGKWPTYYPDNLPPVVNVGPGSPTGVVFGYGAKFPEKYRQALFIADWSYGNIYAVHLTPKGSTYVGELKRFVSAAPLPVTDMIVRPQDGALYFAVGGRRTSSALYRVTYSAEAAKATAAKPGDSDTGDRASSVAPGETAATSERDPARAAALRKLRRKLESFHGRRDPAAVETVWPHLDHSDRFIRYAARIALEHQPTDGWRERALAEKRPWAVITAMVGLARRGSVKHQGDMLAALGRLEFSDLNRQQQLALLRAYALTCIRLGRPKEPVRKEIAERLAPHFPGPDPMVNRELARVLVYLGHAPATSKIVEQLEKGATQEQQIHYAYVLRAAESGWTLEDRKRYFRWFNKAAGARGGASFGGFLRNIKNEAIAKLSPEEKKALAAVLKEPPQTDPYAELKARKFVKNWKVDDLLPEVEAGLAGRDFERGRRVFSQALCFRCHRFAGDGGIVAPDLTGAGRRFGPRDLLSAVLEPSKAISDQYESIIVVTEDGQVITGKIVNLSGPQLRIMTDMLDPGSLKSVRRGAIESIRPSPISMMPEGLLNNFSKEEVLDLIAYLQSGGDRQHAVFGKPK